MKTIYAGLPFYDSIDKQDYRRTNAPIPFYCPSTHLLPFLICDEIASVPSSFDVYLVNVNTGTETLINSYFATTPRIISFTSDFYIVYDGANLTTPIPRGAYYLRVEIAPEYSYYSEIFAIVDVTSGTWCALTFSNTQDIGNILYATGGFEQVYYLNTQLNYPANEIVEVGEEKDGEFIAEKIVTKYMYRISTYVSRALHRCLIRLPQHDDILIADDEGDSYTPSVGNVQITTDWPSFDVAHVVIQFNDGANTAFKWTYGMTNIT